jgi:hypothetical protein
MQVQYSFFHSLLSRGEEKMSTPHCTHTCRTSLNPILPSKSWSCVEVLLLHELFPNAICHSFYIEMRGTGIDGLDPRKGVAFWILIVGEMFALSNVALWILPWRFGLLNFQRLGFLPHVLSYPSSYVIGILPNGKALFLTSYQWSGNSMDSIEEYWKREPTILHKPIRV